MGVMAERPGRDIAPAAVAESLGQHLRHWLRDRLVVWLGAMLRRSRKIYDGPCPGDDEADAPRARGESLRRDSGVAAAAAAPGSPPPKKRSKAWLVSGLLMMFVLGASVAGSFSYWFFESSFEANDRMASTAIKEAKAAEKKMIDAQRSLGTLKEDLASLKLMRQSDQARIQHLTNLLRGRGTEIPAATAANALPLRDETRTATVGSASTGRTGADGACTLSGTGVGAQFKDCVAAMNAGQR